tara:strand:- start:781 stop:948 length:168 start_codon:yes stop_codon:yes gene_type:complete
MLIMSDNKDKEFENTLKELLTDMVNKIEDKSLIDGTYTIQRNQKGKLELEKEKKT